jgi:D-ribose pyranose/furanose isomerase RbsD
MGQYTWLAEKKEQEMAKKLQRRGMPSYRQLPVSERYGVSYTGRGPDGRLQPEAPAGMDLAGRHLFHEGEMKADTPEGSMYLNARTTGMAYPETEQQQAEMKMYEKSGQLPGFQTGGMAVKQITAPEITPVVQQIKPQGTVQTQNIPTVQPVKTVTTQTPTAQTIPKLTNQPNQISVQTPTAQNIPVPAGRQVRTVTTQPQQDYTVNIPQLNQGQQEDFARQQENNQNEIANRAKEQAYREARDQEAERLATEEANRAKEEAYKKNRDEQNLVAGRQPIPTETTTEDLAREQGMKWFMDALNKENPALMVEGRRALSELSSRQQQERNALEQQLLQQRVDPGRARIEAQMLRNNQEGELNDLAAQFGIAGMKSRQEIAGTLASQGLQGQQFEEERNRYKDSADWKAYEAAIAAGDFDTAAKAYQKVTGNSISMDQMKTYQNYLNTRNQQELTQGQLAIDSLRNKIGDEKWNSIQSRISGGASLAQVNAEFPGLNLTQEDFKNMYDATPLGERTWERNMSYAKTLLEAGGEANIKAAAGIFNNAFPGTGIDFSKVITADKAASFNAGMSQLGTYVAAGMDYETAITAMKKDGTFDMLGLSEADVEKLYRGVKTNAIDEQWKAISSSEWYQNLDDEKKKDMSDFFTAVLTGELDYTIQKEYTVTNKDGSTSTMYFNTEADANAYGVQNGTTMVATGKSKVTPRTNVLGDGDGDGAGTTPTKRTEPLGTIIIENGKIYQVIADGNTQEIIPDVDDPWSDNNSKILKAGEKDNQYYKTILDERYKDVTDDGKIFETRKFYALNDNENLKGLSYDDPIIQRLKKEIEENTKKNPELSNYRLKETGERVPMYLYIVKDGNTWKMVTSPDKEYKG